MKEVTCCFTGHRRLPSGQIQAIVERLDNEIDKLIALGVADFISGGALGFDQLAASLIVAKKKIDRGIRLILALPCRNQDAIWTQKEKQFYRELLAEADDIIYVSEDYDANCMKNRNHYMVDQSAFCICALLNENSGTGQTVRYARKQNLQVINVITRPF